MQKQIINIFWKDMDNIGDRMSGAGLYFDFPLPVKFVDIKTIDLPKEELEKSFIIIGGGGHLHLPSLDYNNNRMEHLELLASLSKWTVLWGIGNNIHNTKQHIYPDCLNKFILVGLRDFSNPYEYVPCPSCMSPLFDEYKTILPHRNSIVYKHKFTEKLSENYLIPSYECEGITMGKSLEAIATAHTIFTDSYHGAYWSLLLNKTVVVPNPYSSKFYSLHPNLIIRGEEQSGFVDKSINYLEKCREANISFYARVLEKVFEYMES